MIRVRRRVTEPSGPVPVAPILVQVGLGKPQSTDVVTHEGGSLAVVDGDDTLWITEPLYDDARDQAAKIVASAGIDPTLWDQLERVIDVDNVARLGLDASRFPTSCVEAYVAAAEQTGVEVRETVAAEVRAAASSVFQRVAPLAPHANDFLAGIRPEFDTLVLHTQGDSAIQHKRVADSGLSRWFDFVWIVRKKSQSELAQLLSKVGASPRRSVCIGNSLRSDINPALAIGMAAVWVERHVWDYETDELAGSSQRLAVVTDLGEVPKAIVSVLGGVPSALS